MTVVLERARPASQSGVCCSERGRSDGGRNEVTAILLRRAAAIVGAELGVDPEAILGGTRQRGRQLARPRQLAMYLAATSFECSKKRMALLLNRRRWCVQRAVRLIAEERDDDPALDRLVRKLERRSHA